MILLPPTEELQNFFAVFLHFQSGVDIFEGGITVHMDTPIRYLCLDRYLLICYDMDNY